MADERTRTYRNGVAAAVIAAGLVVALLGGVARADLVSLWWLDETVGTTASNAVAGGSDGTLNNGPAWTYDAQRGLVLGFDGGDDYVDAGGIPAITTTDSFTVAFWGRQDGAQSINNDVILGNRFGGTNNSWAKFTPNAFEWHPNSVNNHIDYANVPGDQWIHHAVVKNGTALTYYRDGVPAGTATATADMPVLPFYMGGDATTERWRGRLDNVALFDEALAQAQVQTVMGGDFSAYGAAKPTAMSDSFDGTSVDAAKWNVINKGLQSTVDGGYNAPAVGGGTVTLGGTTTHSYWAGKTLSSTDSFDVPAGGEVKFDVDRVSLTGTGSAYRSSMWMYADGTHYHHFSQNIGETNWQFNAGNNNPTGSGVQLTRGNAITDGGAHKMTLAHDGAYVKMFLDGRWLGSQAADFQQFNVMLTGQARAATDTVSAQFDNAAVATRTFSHMYDNFNAAGIDPGKWTVLNKGLENQGSFTGNLAARVQDGELIFEGATGSQYWYGVTLQTARPYGTQDLSTFTVDRDALDRGSASAVRGSVWLWADDEHFLHFSQNLGENGWQYNYRDGGTGPGGGGGVNLAAFDGLDGDPGFHEMQLELLNSAGGVEISMYLDGQYGATQAFTDWGNRPYYFMISGMPRDNNDSVFAAFDNVRIAANIPEPATLVLVLLGLGGVGLKARRRIRK